MNRIKYLILTLGIIAGFGLAALPTTAGAVNVFSPCDGNTDSAVCGGTGDDFKGFIKTGVNLLLYLLGAVAVIMIIYAGILYVISGGDTTNTKKAKDTILYSVVGLVVALMAYAIVNFVIDSLIPSTDTGGTSQNAN